jgi:hypothetical protein
MVKCSECGFLAARDIDTRRLDEVEKAFRESGSPPVRYVSGRNQYVGQERVPICFVQAYDLKQEIEIARGSDAMNATWVHFVINQDRECQPFMEWQQGFTPKEHREMLDREAMLKWQTEREEADKKWRENESKENRKWRFREFLIAAIAVIVVIIAAILGAIIERGGQPTINIITPNPESITIEHQP